VAAVDREAIELDLARRRLFGVEVGQPIKKRPDGILIMSSRLIPRG